jgi:integrase/recombinase XerD
LITNWNKEVAENKQRKHNLAIANLYFGKNIMAKQAKVLNNMEIRRVLDYVATRKHSARNSELLSI